MRRLHLAPAPENPHRGLPVQGSLYRYSIGYTDPQGQAQALSITSTWQPQDERAQQFWRNLCRGLIHSGCRLREVTAYREVVVEL